MIKKGAETMFHRVKPEAQSEQEKSAQPAEQKTQEQNQEVAKVPVQQSTEAAAPESKKAEQKPQQMQNTVSSDTTKETPKETSKEATKAKKEQRQMNQTSQKQSSEPTQKESGAEPMLDIPNAAYQKGPKGPRPAASYPGSYAAGTSSYSAPGAATTPPAPTPISDSANDRRLTIGRGITMSGEIEACDHLLVEGTVEAALRGANVLDIAESGTFYGTVEIEEANVAGRFEGDITVQGRLTIKASGTITGSIAYGELEVESGATIDGRLTPVSALPAEGKKPMPQAAPKAKVQQGEQQEAPAANADAALFEGSEAVAE